MERRPTDLAKTQAEALEESGNENKISVEQVGLAQDIESKEQAAACTIISSWLTARDPWATSVLQL